MLPNRAAGADPEQLPEAGLPRADRAQVAELLARHGPWMLALAQRLAGRSIAEDVVQDAFCQVMVHLPLFRGEAQIAFWLKRIVVNRCRDLHKHSRRNEVALPEELLASLEDRGARDAEREVGNRQVLAALERALPSLKPIYREAFVLKHLEHLSYEQISALTGLNVPVLKVRVHRAREMLLDALRPILDLEPHRR